MKFKQMKKYWFLLPAFIIYSVFIIYPMFDSFLISLTKWNGLSADREFIGLANYINFFKDPISYKIIMNNLIWMVLSLIVPIFVGLILAVILNSKIKGKNIFRSIFYSPAILPLISVGVIWAWIYDPMFGALNTLLKSVGLGHFSHAWLGSKDTALYAVIVTGIWKGVGLPMILFLAGLQDIPKRLYEAAEIDGANKIQTFFNVTIPMLRESFVIVVSLVVVGSLKIFDLIYVMTWGGPGKSTQVLATWMYNNTFLYEKAGYGSAIAWIMTIVSLAIIIPYIKIMSSKNTL